MDSLRHGLIYSWVPEFGYTGVTLRDQGRHKRHLTLANITPADAWAVDGKDSVAPGYKIEYDGTDSQASRDGTTAIQTYPVTMFARFRSNQAHVGGVVMIGVAVDGNGFVLVVVTNEIWALTQGSAAVKAVAAITHGVWTSVSGEFESDTLRRILVDGVLIQTNTDNQDAPGTFDTTQIGRRLTGVQPFDGAVGVVHVYDRFLTAAETRFLHAHPLAPVEIDDLRVVGKAPAAAGAFFSRRYYDQYLSGGMSGVAA